MSVFIAIGHIVGAFIVLGAIGVGQVIFAKWHRKRHQKGEGKVASLALGIPVGELASAEHRTKFTQFVAAKFSSDLLRNRLSDLCWWVQIGWNFLGSVIQVGVLLVAIWYTLTSDLSNSVHIWWSVPILFFFWISSVLFAQACKVLTGRLPGQARAVRKALARFVGGQNAAATNS